MFAPRCDTIFNHTHRSFFYSFGDLHEESMAGIMELTNFVKEKFESLEDENTRISDQIKEISDVSFSSSRKMEVLEEKMDAVETMANDTSEEVRSSKERLEALSLDVKLGFEETEQRAKEMDEMIEEVL